MSAPKLRTTKPARSTCRCPLCAGTTTGADGVYHCRAGETVEYLVFVAGDFCGAYASFLTAETQLNAARRDRLTAPVELAAAEADLDAQAEEYVAEQDCDCVAPAAQAEHADYEEWVRTHTWPYFDPCTKELTIPGLPSDEAPAEPLPFTPDNSPLDPRPTPPAISYNAATGLFSWVGAPRSYPTFLAADVARTAWLKRRRITAAYPRTPREVRAELVSRGLLLAA